MAVAVVVVQRGRTGTTARAHGSHRGRCGACRGTRDQAIGILFLYLFRICFDRNQRTETARRRVVARQGVRLRNLQGHFTPIARGCRCYNIRRQGRRSCGRSSRGNNHGWKRSQATIGILIVVVGTCTTTTGGRRQSWDAAEAATPAVVVVGVHDCVQGCFTPTVVTQQEIAHFLF